MTRLDPGNTQSIAAAGATLARAFHGDPGFGWTFRDPDLRKRALAFLHPRVVALHAPAGQCWVKSERGGEMVAVAVWAPPGVHFGVWSYLAQGLLQMPLRFGWNNVRRMLFVDNVMKRIREQYSPPNPCWYLDSLGVVPERQGEGVGSTLLRETLMETVEHVGQSASLFTTKPRNLPFYERHGFAVVHRERVGADSGFDLWFMTRAGASKGCGVSVRDAERTSTL